MDPRCYNRTALYSDRLILFYLYCEELDILIFWVNLLVENLMINSYIVPYKNSLKQIRWLFLLNRHPIPSVYIFYKEYCLPVHSP